MSYTNLLSSNSQWRRQKFVGIISLMSKVNKLLLCLQESCCFMIGQRKETDVVLFLGGIESLSVSLRDSTRTSRNTIVIPELH